MYAAGLNVEGAKGECNFGQHEIGFLYDDVVVTADNHAVYKTVAKEIASLHGKSLTFMAKYDEREGNSCHIHLSLRGHGRRHRVLGRRRWRSRTPLYDSLRRRRARERGRLHPPVRAEHQLLQAVRRRARSRRRRSRGARTTAPARCAWSATAPSARMENRLPGGDVNPYLALAAMLAGGLHGIEEGLELEPPLEGNAYTSDAAAGAAHPARRAGGVHHAPSWPARPWVTRSSTTTPTWPTSSWPPFESSVTDWERRRSFERMSSERCEKPSTKRDVDVHRRQPGDRRAGARRAARGRRRRPTPRSSGHSAPFRRGRRVAPGERARLLRAFAAVVDAHIDELAAARGASTPATRWATPRGRPATSATA